jgi:hypothetical protein
MAATGNIYQSGLMKCLDGTIVILTDTIKIVLVKSTYAPNRDHDFLGDVTEITGVSGYTGGFAGAGRKTLASKTLAVTDASDLFTFDAADVAFGALGTGDTIGGAVITKEITNDAASPIVAFNGVANTPTNGASVTFQFDSAGIFTVTAT